MNTILKLLLLFVVAYYLVKYAFKVFVLFKPTRSNAENNKRVDDFVDYSQKNQSKSSKLTTEGDYVDFEEVK